MTNWTPRPGEDRQRDHTRTNKRADRLRENQTKSELRLWKLLRQLNRDGARFRRQLAVGDYVYDFGDFTQRLLIELDGGIHRLPDVILRDEAKTAWAHSQGFRLLRITTADLYNKGDATLRLLRQITGIAPHP